MKPLPLLLLTSVPDTPDPSAIARILVEERLAACCTLLARGESFFIWNEQAESAAECVMLIKTTNDRLEALRDRPLDLHPYDIPELIEIPIAGGLASYMEWIVSARIPPRHERFQEGRHPRLRSYLR